MEMETETKMDGELTRLTMATDVSTGPSRRLLFRAICWNPKPSEHARALPIGRAKLRKSVLETFRLVQPSVVLLQDNIWAGSRFCGRLLEAEDAAQYDLLPYGWQLVHAHRHTMLMYDPAVLTRAWASEREMRTQWRAALANVDPALPSTACLLAASAGPGRSLFAFLSLRLPLRCDTARTRLAADVLAVTADCFGVRFPEYNVLIGADWRCAPDSLASLLPPDVSVASLGNEQCGGDALVFKRGSGRNVLLGNSHVRQFEDEHFKFVYEKDHDPIVSEINVVHVCKLPCDC